MIINFIPAMGKEEMEMQLWAYIDKQCGDAEAERIAALVANDKQWREQYEQLLAFHKELAATEPEQPSLRFSRNVMEAINATQPAPATRSYINPWILRGVLGVFILLLAVTFIYTLPLINWSAAADTRSSFQFDMSKIDMGKWWLAIAGVNIVLLIVLIDAIIRQRTRKAL